MDSHLRNKGEWRIGYSSVSEMRNNISISKKGESKQYGECQNLDGMYGNIFQGRSRKFILAKAFSRKYIFLITKEVNDYFQEPKPESREIIETNFIYDRVYSFRTEMLEHGPYCDEGVLTTHNLTIFEKKEHGKIIQIDLDDGRFTKEFGTIVKPLKGTITIHPTVDGEHFFIESGGTYTCFDIKGLFDIFLHVAQNKFSSHVQTFFASMRESCGEINVDGIISMPCDGIGEGIYFFSKDKFMVIINRNTKDPIEFIFFNRNHIVQRKMLEKFGTRIITKSIVLRKNHGETVVFISHCFSDKWRKDKDLDRVAWQHWERGKMIEFMFLDENGKNYERRERKFGNFIKFIRSEHKKYLSDIFVKLFPEGFLFFGVDTVKNDLWVSISYIYDLYEGNIHLVSEKMCNLSEECPDFKMDHHIYFETEKRKIALSEGNEKYLKRKDKEERISLLLEGVS